MKNQTWKAAVSAAAICVAAALSPLHAADEAITSDTMLTADRTVDGVLKMSPGVVVDLNGHTLTAKGVAIANDDLTSPSGTVTLEGSLIGNTRAANLFNNNFSLLRNSTHRIVGSLPISVTYDFGDGTPQKVRSYNVWCGKQSNGAANIARDLMGRCPTAWTLYGSNDNSAWTQLDSRSSVVWEDETWYNPVKKTFDVANPGEYRYYKISFTAIGALADVLEVVQLEYLPHAESAVQSPVIENMEDLTTTDESAVSSTSTFDLNTKASALFDNRFHQTRHSPYPGIACIARPGYHEVDYDFGEGNARIVRSYRIYTGPYAGSDGVDRNPGVWTIQGSNDGETWTVVDEREERNWEITAEGRHRDYVVASPGVYRIYRIKVTKNFGEIFNRTTYVNQCCMMQLEYFAGTCFEEHGTLVLDVPADTTTENSVVSLAGDMALVKKGAGTFLAKKTGQTYTGGTVVSNGTFKCGANGTIFGASGSSVEIASGAVLDVNGHYEYTGYPLVFAGGTLKNTGAASANNMTFGNIRLTADSAIDVANRYGFKGGEENVAKPNTFLDLGGHTLTISGAGMFNISNCKYDNGTIQELPGHSQVLDIRNGGVMTNNVTFISDGGFASYEGTGVAHYLDMQDYIAGYTQYNRGFGTSTSRVRVWGTFKPLSVNYHGITMQDGSAIDLSGMAEPLPLVPNYVPGAGTLNFANGATVEIKVGQRAVRSSTALVSWSAPPSNIGGVTFVCNDDSRRRKVQVKDTGLYFAQDGLMLIVK